METSRTQPGATTVATRGRMGVPRASGIRFMSSNPAASPQTSTLAAELLPAPALPRLLRDAMLVLAGSAIVAASARLTIPLEPVPVTGQTFGVLVVAMALGSRLGTLALAAYLIEGLAGLPVFAGGASGPGAIAGPSGGYLIGYLPAAWLIGRLAELGWDRTVSRTALAMLAGNVALYVPGLLWLGWHVSGLPAEELGGQSLVMVVLWGGLIPFIPGDAIKLALAAVVMPLGWKLARWRSGQPL